MTRPAPLPLRFRSLHESPLVRVRVYSCHAGRSGPAPEERSSVNDGGIKVRVSGKEITVCCDECATKARAGRARAN